MKKLKIFLSIIIASVFLMVNTSNVIASEPEEENWNSRKAYIEEKMIELGSQGFDKVDKWLELNGIKKLEIEVDDSFPMSDPGNINLYSIDGYFDTLSKKYLVKGWWSWNGTAYVDPNAGALEGVALSMSNTDFSPATGYILDSNPAGIAVYDQSGNYYSNTGGASKIDKSGISYIYQDAWIGSKYRGYKGQVWFWMTVPPTASSSNPLYLKMHYIHTWSSANLDSFGLKWQYGSPPELNMTWSTKPAQWPRTNQVVIHSWEIK